MRHLVAIIDRLRERSVVFRSICIGVIDTTSASGELVLGIFAVLARFERRLVQERTWAGLKAARARGRLGGRSKISSSIAKVRVVKALHSNGTPIDVICRSQAISGATLYRYLAIE